MSYNEFLLLPHPNSIRYSFIKARPYYAWRCSFHYWRQNKAVMVDSPYATLMKERYRWRTLPPSVWMPSCHILKACLGEKKKINSSSVKAVRFALSITHNQASSMPSRRERFADFLINLLPGKIGNWTHSEQLQTKNNGLCLWQWRANTLILFRVQPNPPDSSSGLLLNFCILSKATAENQYPLVSGN